MAKQKRSVTNFYKSQSGLTLMGVILLFGFILLIVLGISYVFGVRITSQIGTKVTTGQAIIGSYTTLPPSLLNSSVPVVYNVSERRYRIVGAGPPTIFGSPTPLQGAIVTFKLVTGDASVDGGTEKVVRTSTNGNAQITLKPEKDGSDVLELHLEYGNVSGDEDPQYFEVDKP